MPGFTLRPAARMLSFIAGAAILGLGSGLSTASAAQLGASPLPVMTPVAASAPTPANSPGAVPSPEVVPSAAATEAPTTGRHHKRHRDAAPTAIPSPGDAATPVASSYTGFTGIWEMQLQHGALTSYTHMVFQPDAGTILVGEWMNGTTPTPLTGEVDGDRFRLSGTDAHGPFTLSGYEENFTNLVGQMVQGTNRVPFTARHQGSLAHPGAGRHKRRHKGDLTAAPHD